jgi:hypothetical protein
VEDNEKLIAKIQLEYTSGTSIAIVKDLTEWDIGLLYFTNKNLWFINSQRDRTQIPFMDIINLDTIKARTSEKATKFTKVLGATYCFNIDFKTKVDDKDTILTIQISAAKEILSALKSQLQVRLEHRSKAKKGELQLDKSELLKRLAVLLQLEIDDEEKLEYFLGIPERDLVNLMIERNRILQKAN